MRDAKLGPEVLIYSGNRHVPFSRFKFLREPNRGKFLELAITKIKGI